MNLSMEHHVIRKNFGDAEAIRMIAKAGFDALDFSFYWLYGEENFLDREDRLEYAKELRAVADEAGIAITQAHAPFDLKLTASKEQQAYDYEQIVRAIEFAGILGVQQIVVHNLVTADNADFEKVNLEFYRNLEATAAKANVRIAVENLWKRAGDKIIGERLSTPETLSAPVWTWAILRFWARIRRISSADWDRSSCRRCIFMIPICSATPTRCLIWASTTGRKSPVLWAKPAIRAI